MKFLTAMTAKVEAGYLSSARKLSSLTLTDEEWQPIVSEGNTTLVLTCFEEDDDAKAAKEAASRILNIHKRAKGEVKSVTLVPFAHLSDQAMGDLEQVGLLLDILRRSIERGGFKVIWAPPNSSNVLFSKLLIFDKLQTVRLGTSESSLRRTLVSLIRAFGPQKVMSVFGSVLKLKESTEPRNPLT